MGEKHQKCKNVAKLITIGDDQGELRLNLSNAFCCFINYGLMDDNSTSCPKFNENTPSSTLSLVCRCALSFLRSYSSWFGFSNY